MEHRRTYSDSAAIARSSPRARLSPYSSPALTPRSESSVQSQPSSTHSVKSSAKIGTYVDASLPPSADLPQSPPSPPSFDCAICQMPMEDPAVGGGCAHHFCLSCYQEWCSRKASCPTCRSPVWKIVVDTEFAAQSGIELSAAETRKAETLAAAAALSRDGSAAAAAADIVRTNSKERTVEVPGPAGITLANRTNGDGCCVVRVMKHNGAHRAGIRAGDVILKVNGADVHDHNVAVAFIEARCRVGDCAITFRTQPDVRALVAQTILRRVRSRAAVTPTSRNLASQRGSPLGHSSFSDSSDDPSTSTEGSARSNNSGQENAGSAPLLANAQRMLVSPSA